MTINWKKDLKPESLLLKFNGLRVSYGTNQTFRDLSFLTIPMEIAAMLDFGEEHSEIDKFEVVENAIDKTNGKLEKDTLLTEIKTISNKILEEEKKIFYLLTSLSVKFNKKNIVRKFQDTVISITERTFSNRFHSRCNEALAYKYANPRQYSKVVAKIRAYSPKCAASTGLKIIDLQRSIWCLLCNDSPSFSLSFVPLIPINKIRLGQIHTIHTHTGEIFKNYKLIEPEFELNSVYNISNNELQKSRLILKFLNNCNYSDVIINSLIMYVRALDYKDHNVGLMRLWSAIEMLTLTTEEKNKTDKLIQRCSKLHKDRIYNKHLLELIRERRNKNVHAGEDEMQARDFCYKLHNTFKKLIIYHLKYGNKFTTQEEANYFIDKNTYENIWSKDDI